MQPISFLIYCTVIFDQLSIFYPSRQTKICCRYFYHQSFNFHIKVGYSFQRSRKYMLLRRSFLSVGDWENVYPFNVMISFVSSQAMYKRCISEEYKCNSISSLHHEFFCRIGFHLARLPYIFSGFCKKIDYSLIIVFYACRSTNANMQK